jgi:hypothetical protein
MLMVGIASIRGVWMFENRNKDEKITNTCAGQ